MKKLFALALALCLLCACACAEETAEAINWPDIEANASAYPGSFRAVGTTGMEMYIPDLFTEAEITDDQEEAGVILLLNGEGKYAVAASWIMLEDDMSVDQYLADIGAAGVESLTVNGLEAVGYDQEINGLRTSSVLYYFEDDDSLLIFSYGPMDDEEFQPIAVLMMASVREE